MDSVIREIIKAGRDVYVLREQVKGDIVAQHICTSSIAKLSNAYHEIMRGDVDEDLIEFYDIISYFGDDDDD